MKKILKEFLKKKYNWEYIEIDNYDVDGAICSVKFYTDITRTESEKENINIWDMLVFLNEK